MSRLVPYGLIKWIGVGLWVGRVVHVTMYVLYYCTIHHTTAYLGILSPLATVRSSKSWFFLSIIYKAQQQTYIYQLARQKKKRPNSYQPKTWATTLPNSIQNHNEPLIDPPIAGDQLNCDRTTIATAVQLRAIDPQRPMRSDQFTASSYDCGNRLTSVVSIHSDSNRIDQETADPQQSTNKPLFWHLRQQNDGGNRLTAADHRDRLTVATTYLRGNWLTAADHRDLAADNIKARSPPKIRPGPLATVDQLRTRPWVLGSELSGA